ncbi:MAG: histidine phosphatase family protein [Bacillus sp. (in: firmicutes)]
MEISLIRHGKSQLVKNKPITGKEFEEWVCKYNRMGILEKPSCPTDTLNKAKASTILITSNLTRSIESAQMINPTAKIICDPLFRECELPISPSSFFGLQLTPNYWALLFRLLWFTGYSPKCEPFKQARHRATKAAERLIEFAMEHESAILVGHGLFNRLVAGELRKKGWTGSRKASAKHWVCIAFTRT